MRTVCLSRFSGFFREELEAQLFLPLLRAIVRNPEMAGQLVFKALLVNQVKACFKGELQGKLALRMGFAGIFPCISGGQGNNEGFCFAQ